MKLESCLAVKKKECRGNVCGLLPNVSSVVEFQRLWVLKSKIFGQESTYLKEKNLKKSIDVYRFVKNWA